MCLLNWWFLLIKCKWNFVVEVLWNNLGVKNFIIVFWIFFVVNLGWLCVVFINGGYGFFCLGVIWICIFVKRLLILIVVKKLGLIFFKICVLIFLLVFVDIGNVLFFWKWVIVVYGVNFLFFRIVILLVWFVWYNVLFNKIILLFEFFNVLILKLFCVSNVLIFVVFVIKFFIKLFSVLCW